MNMSEYLYSRITISSWAMAFSGTIGYKIKGTVHFTGHIFANCQSK